MKISIAMATYNGARFLREQLDSFTTQTRLPDELVVCDDASSDATLDILRDFSSTAPFKVRIEVNDKNIGYIKNFEKAISLCAGDLIFLSDQDDVWLPEKLATILREFEADPALMVTINDMIIADADLVHKGITQLDTIRATHFGEQRFVAGCCVAVKGDLLPILLPFPEHGFAHDAWIGDVAVALGVRRLVDTPLQIYRRHGANESQWLLSDPRGVSRFRMVVKSGLASPVSGWKASIERLSIIEERISSNVTALRRMGLADCIAPALLYLKSEQIDYRGRLGLLSKPRWRRWVSIARFWTGGGYRRFAGWQSAAKDIIRP